jgi:DNA-directed RNA polymerase subunit RPC12/RpoP
MSTCYCLTCGAEFDPRRAALGYQTCMDCGHEAAIAMRTAWCIAPIAHKQGATLVTNKADLRGLNKQER